jgi:hypothetical protein
MAPQTKLSKLQKNILKAALSMHWHQAYSQSENAKNDSKAFLSSELIGEMFFGIPRWQIFRQDLLAMDWEEHRFMKSYRQYLKRDDLTVIERHNAQVELYVSGKSIPKWPNGKEHGSSYGKNIIEFKLPLAEHWHD